MQLASIGGEFVTEKLSRSGARRDFVILVPNSNTMVNEAEEYVSMAGRLLLNSQFRLQAPSPCSPTFSVFIHKLKFEETKQGKREWLEMECRH